MISIGLAAPTSINFIRTWIKDGQFFYLSYEKCYSNKVTLKSSLIVDDRKRKTKYRKCSRKQDLWTVFYNDQKLWKL